MDSRTLFERLKLDQAEVDKRSKSISNMNVRASTAQEINHVTEAQHVTSVGHVTTVCYQSGDSRKTEPQHQLCSKRLQQNESTCLQEILRYGGDMRRNGEDKNVTKGTCLYCTYSRSNVMSHSRRHACRCNTCVICKCNYTSLVHNTGATLPKPAEHLFSIQVMSKTVACFVTPLLLLWSFLMLSLNFLLLRTTKSLQCTTAKSFVIAFIFPASLLYTPAHAQTWMAPPEDTVEHLGNTVKLTCGLSNLDGRDIQWQQFHPNYTLVDTLFINDDRWTENMRYTVHTHSSTSGVTGYDLELSNIEQFDDKLYRCDVNAFEHREATVTVLVPPGVPSIFIENENDLEEGDNATLACSTSGGNPTPSITWYRNDEVISGAHQPSSEKFGTATSVLYWLMTKSDNEAVFKCAVQNEAVSSPLQISRQISVKYKPVIDLGQHNPLVVVELDPVTLHCSLDANPAVDSVDIEWTDSTGLIIHRGATYEVEQALASHAGTYTCRATNTVGSSTAHIVLDVHYGPRLSIQYNQGSIDSEDALRINEGQKLNLTCSVDANPAVNPNTIAWTKDGAPVHTGPWFYTSSVERSDSGSYRCEAHNVLQPSDGVSQPQTGTAQLDVRVQYEPGQAHIFVPEPAIKGETVTLTCTLDEEGFPSATLTWTKLGSPTIIATDSELTFDPLRLEHAGDYICTPSNVVGDGIADIKPLQVLEYSEFLDGGIPSEIEHTINDRGVALTCSVRGNPDPAITWYKDDERIVPNTGYFYTLDVTENRNTTSVLYWEGDERTPYDDSLLTTDSGTYRCEAQNEIDPSSIQDNSIMTVYYAPVLNTTSDKVAVDVSHSGMLQCRAHSTPSTMFTWLNGSTEITSGGRIRITDTYTPGSEYPYESIMDISDIRTTDFGVYMCIGTNNQGSNELEIHLTVKTVPDSPNDLETLDITWESVELRWQPGFDGGYAQEFVVSYMHSGTTVEQVPVGSVTRYNVTHLYPDLNYSFRVVAHNELGTGSPSDPVAANTPDFEVEAIAEGDVTYDENTHTVTFDLPNSDYTTCARIDINDGTDWFNYLPCAPTASGSIKIDSNQHVDAMKVSLCLETRPDVCSDPTVVEIIQQEEDLPTYVVIIIGVICAAIVIALTVVLVILCYKRRQSIKKFEEETKSPTAANVVQDTRNTSIPIADNQLKPAIKVYDNPAHTNPANHSPSYEDRKSPVFATHSSQFDNHDYYQKSNGNGYLGNGSTYVYENQSNVRRERSFKGSNNTHADFTDGNSYPMNPPSRNNSSAADKPYLYLEDPYRLNKDVHNNSGDGSMGSDQIKPKKVMYEVVV